MPKHHQSGRRPDRPNRNQLQQQQRQPRKPSKVAPQQVPRDLSPEPLDDESDRSGGPGAVPHGRHFDALLQESAFRQLGQQQQQKLPLQHQVSPQALDSSGTRSVHQLHPLWPDPSLLGAAIALASVREPSEHPSSVTSSSSEASAQDREAALADAYLQLLGAESLPDCLPDTDPVDLETSPASGDDEPSDSEDDQLIVVNEEADDEFDWLDLDCVAAVAPPRLKLKTPETPEAPEAPTIKQELDEAAPSSAAQHPPVPAPLPPPPPPLVLPDSRPELRRTRDLSELDDDLDKLLQDD
ncbi:hypothetical protein BOX15_Mlig009001g2 [Macrostomum lignano]|uniref:Uncharacterized protein n=2 Tax=Macrostomum lignano TaxID=282301 RepID=A0A267GWZ0_9PLAT|nr:hypothetical protein BOX15_Mlig009001g2 [Macrostomum lignano]